MKKEESPIIMKWEENLMKTAQEETKRKLIKNRKQVPNLNEVPKDLDKYQSQGRMIFL
jgi:hypothetical protein